MKKIYLFTLIVIGGFLSSCNHNNPNDGKFNADSDAGWVNFSTASSGIPDNQTLSIPLTLNADVNDKGLDVTYSVEESETGAAPNSILGTYTQENAIPAGELTGKIELNTAEVSEGSCYQVVVKITGTNNESVQVGLAADEDGVNDPLYPIEHFASIGKIDPSLSYEGTTFFQGSAAYQFTPTLTPIEGEVNSFEINTAWGMGFLPSLNPSLDDLPYAGTLTIQNDGTVVVEGDQPYATGGTGFFNACDGTINYTLGQSYLSDDQITFDVVLSPAN